eukprot:3433619-Rhodomonas_salina.1
MARTRPFFTKPKTDIRFLDTYASEEGCPEDFTQEEKAKHMTKLNDRSTSFNQTAERWREEAPVGTKGLECTGCPRSPPTSLPPCEAAVGK